MSKKYDWPDHKIMFSAAATGAINATAGRHAGSKKVEGGRGERTSEI
jgi:hypothetical protein